MNSTNNSSSDEHEELLAEMELIERLPTQERLKQAKRRRALQLKKWSEYDREILLKNNNQITSSSSATILAEKHYFERERPTNDSKRSSKRKRQSNPIMTMTTVQGVVKKVSKRRGIRFQDHIVLLDAIMRKDYDEVVRLLEVVEVTPNSANEDGLTAIHQVIWSIYFHGSVLTAFPLFGFTFCLTENWLRACSQDFLLSKLRLRMQ